MSTQTQVSLRLLIDKKGKRIIYGEADKEFIDFLFSILTLPVGTVMRILSTEEAMVVPLSNLYHSVGALNISYFETNYMKDNLLKPNVSTTVSNSHVGSLLQMESSSASKSTRTYYRCDRASYGGGTCSNYFTAAKGAKCPGCKNSMTSIAEYVYGEDEVKSNKGGCVKEMVTYMVMDDLTVKPISSISIISLFNALNVDVGQIEEKLISLDIKQGVKLLRASLHSPNALTDVFLHNIDFPKQHYGSNVEEEEEGDEELAQGLWSSFLFMFLVFNCTCHFLFTLYRRLFE